MLDHPSSSVIWLALCWLAAWRVTAMVRYEAGPFDLFSWIRLGLTKVGLQRLVNCFHCTGVWVSTILVLVMFDLRTRSIILILAISGAVSITERALGEEASDV